MLTHFRYPRTMSDLELQLILSYDCTHLFYRVHLKWRVYIMQLGEPFSSKLFLWWSLCTLYLPVCQVSVTVVDS